MVALLVACVPPVPLSAPVVDGARLASPGPVRLFVGQGPTGALAARAAGADLVVWLGDAVRHGSNAAWVRVADDVAGLPVVLLPGPGETSGDRSLRRYLRVTGAPALSGDVRPVPWRAFDVVSGDAALRVVLLAGGEPAFDDELSWLPKVLGATPTLLVSSDGPGQAELEAVARRHSDALIAAVRPGDTGALLLEGRWGEAVLLAREGTWLTWGPDGLSVAPTEASWRARWSASGGWELAR